MWGCGRGETAVGSEVRRVEECGPDPVGIRTRENGGGAEVSWRNICLQPVEMGLERAREVVEEILWSLGGKRQQWSSIRAAERERRGV